MSSNQENSRPSNSSRALSLQQIWVSIKVFGALVLVHGLLEYYFPGNKLYTVLWPQNAFVKELQCWIELEIDSFCSVSYKMLLAAQRYAGYAVPIGLQVPRIVLVACFKLRVHLRSPFPFNLLSSEAPSGGFGMVFCFLVIALRLLRSLLTTWKGEDCRGLPVGMTRWCWFLHQKMWDFQKLKSRYAFVTFRDVSPIF
eukprot:Gb_33338 [translate_table: standard]